MELGEGGERALLAAGPLGAAAGGVVGLPSAAGLVSVPGVPLAACGASSVPLAGLPLPSPL